MNDFDSDDADFDVQFTTELGSFAPRPASENLLRRLDAAMSIVAATPASKAHDKTSRWSLAALALTVCVAVIVWQSPRTVPHARIDTTALAAPSTNVVPLPADPAAWPAFALRKVADRSTDEFERLLDSAPNSALVSQSTVRPESVLDRRWVE